MKAMANHFLTAAAMLGIAAGAAFAQSSEQAELEQMRVRQRIASMELQLAQAVSIGADNVIRQWKDLAPDQAFFMGAPEARGLRLTGYGILFDVEVPQLRVSLLWPLLVLAQDQTDRQALRRGVSAATVGSPRQPAAAPAPAEPSDPIVDLGIIDDLQTAYRTEVKRALIDAIIENSTTLALGPDEWLAIAARRSTPRDPLQPGSSLDSGTVVLRIKGSDLAAFRTGQITLEEARARVEEAAQ